MLSSDCISHIIIDSVMEQCNHNFTIAMYLSKAIAYVMSDNFGSVVKGFCDGCFIDEEDPTKHMCVMDGPVKQIKMTFPYLVEMSDYKRILDVFKFHIIQQGGDIFVPGYFFHLLSIKRNLLEQTSFLHNQVMKDMLDIVDD